MGADGIYETLDGRHNVYQAKFRTGRPSLSWRELSTFFGLTDAVDERVLITNCNDLPDIVEARGGFHCIRGNDLDRLGPADFKAIAAWLEGEAVTRAHKSPLPHQQEAIEKIVAGLGEHDRATSIMACGTGKTLVALWVAEQLAPRRLIVLLPSLALLRQTLHEWLHETALNDVAYLCVCSDPTVTAAREDAMVVRQSDLDFPVETSPETVRKFLGSPYEGTRIVFTTYQSAPIVGEAMAPGERFDLGIFDEAHKTAGREGARFGFALNDANIPIARRLFLTATPRHYDIRKRDKEGDAKQVFSMDALETYGPRVHTLTFSEAARQGIICDYRVVISIVTNAMVNDELLRHGEVLVEGDPIRARHVANQIALQKAVEAHDLTRVFTFHRNVKAAQSFTSEGPEGIGNHLPDFASFHVNGTMPTARRDAVLNEFRNARRAVISNARCLTEGVDVPAVDLVGFMSPKRSKVDIVQAAGRAMRRDPRNPAKVTGYILLPLFIEEDAGESLEDALDRSEFGEVWDVLQAMQEHDDVIADVVTQMRQERGRTGGFDESRLSERVEFLGPALELDALRSAITTRVVEQLGTTWEEMFGRLVAFREREGDCLVPAKFRTDEGFRLGGWVSEQRTARDTMPPERKADLNALGFDWDRIGTAWAEGYENLSAFKEREGHCLVPAKFRTEDGFGLGVWVASQRKARDTMPPERKAALDELGFEWTPLGAAWTEGYRRLVAFKESEGHCRVAGEFRTEDGFRLGQWVSTQRLKQDTMPPERKADLNALGFDWDRIGT
ncbi:MAG: Helicase associated domain protein, partial [Chloroflexi bacterium]|nr:Helicase associated domain protein [Chloroflexota bacterium]